MTGWVRSTASIVAMATGIRVPGPARKGQHATRHLGPQVLGLASYQAMSGSAWTASRQRPYSTGAEGPNVRE